MPDTTDCRNLPFPLDPDPIDVATDIQNLAEAVDADTCEIRAKAVHPLAVQIDGNNIPQGVTTLNGTLSLPASTITRSWIIWYKYYFAGHGTGSNYRIRMIRSDGGPVAISGYDHYNANEPHGGSFLASFGIDPGIAETIQFQVEIDTAFANTNSTGIGVALGMGFDL